MENLNVEKFKTDYSIIDSKFESTGLDWDKLDKIYRLYSIIWLI